MFLFVLVFVFFLLVLPMLLLLLLLLVLLLVLLLPLSSRCECLCRTALSSAKQWLRQLSPRDVNSFPIPGPRATAGMGRTRRLLSRRFPPRLHCPYRRARRGRQGDCRLLGGKRGKSPADCHRKRQERGVGSKPTGDEAADCYRSRSRAERIYMTRGS